MPAPSSFDYSLIRVVPRVERGEQLNAGVVLYCRTRDFLGAKIELPRERLLALAPGVDLESIEAHLRALQAVCEGAAGPLAALSLAERFHWLVSPRSTVVQLSPVHSGLCDAPDRALADLFSRLVAAPKP